MPPYCYSPPAADLSISRSQVTDRLDGNGLVGYMRVWPAKTTEGGLKFGNMPTSSIYYLLGLCPGDIAVSLAGKRFDRAEDMGPLIKALRNETHMKMRMYRRNIPYEVNITIK
jgi:type II secretory pathway component PulC